MLGCSLTFRFSALMNVRTHGVQAGDKISLIPPVASPKNSKKQRGALGLGQHKNRVGTKLTRWGGMGRFPSSG